MHIMFPNLEKLDLQDSDSLYSFSKMLIENSKFTHLKSLSSNPKNKVQAEFCLKCLDFLKERITTIELTDDTNNSGSLYQDLHNKLSAYTKLKKVVINLPITEKMYMNDSATIYFRAIIEQNGLPSLQNLSIISIKDSTYISLYTAKQDALLPTNTLENIYIDRHSKCNYIVGESFMVFMMNKFPSLKSLTCREIKVHQRYGNTYLPSNPYYKVLLQFLRFLFKIPRCIFPNIVLSDANAIKLIENFNSETERNPISSTIIAHTLAIESSYFPDEGSIYDSRGVIHFEDNGRQIKVHLKLIWKKKPANIDLKQLNAIKENGRFFDKISLEISSNENIVATLDHITRYCSRLSNLTLTDKGEKSEELFVYEEEVIKSTSIKNLNLEKLILSQEQLFYTTNQLPSLENLILSNCFMHNNGDALDQSFHTISLPTLSLNCLKINFNKDFSNSADGKSYYIKLTTEMNEKPRYCVLTAKYKKEGLVGYSLLENPSESAFYDSMLKPKNATYLIYCKSVKKFTVEYIQAENGYCKKIEMLSDI